MVMVSEAKKIGFENIRSNCRGGRMKVVQVGATSNSFSRGSGGCRGE